MTVQLVQVDRKTERETHVGSYPDEVSANAEAAKRRQAAAESGSSFHELPRFRIKPA